MNVLLKMRIQLNLIFANIARTMKSKKYRLTKVMIILIIRIILRLLLILLMQKERQEVKTKIRKKKNRQKPKQLNKICHK